MQDEDKQEHRASKICSSQLPPPPSTRIPNGAHQPPSRFRPRGSAQRKRPRRRPPVQPGARGPRPPWGSCGSGGAS
eukprot:12245779-Alexandrium_andersonii.AAC.1